MKRSLPEIAGKLVELIRQTADRRKRRIKDVDSFPYGEVHECTNTTISRK